MKTLADVCRSLCAVLEQAGEAVEAISAELKLFEKQAAYWPATWIALTLQLVGLRVALEAAQQSLNHDGKGVVCIRTVHDGRLFVDWIEDDSVLTEERRSWQAKVTSLPEEQFSAFLKQLLGQLHQGDWKPAVGWLQAHGKWVAPLKPI